MNKFTNFADLAAFVADQREDAALTETYEGAFIEANELAKMTVYSAPEQLDMPDPEQARAAVELMIATVFDVFRDTRMEAYAADLAWGITNSFHVVAKRIADREDDAALRLGELVRVIDPSEIHATEQEDAQLLCQTLQGCREAMEVMRDHAGEVYRVETGKPFSTVRGSRVSKALTASQIEGRDFLAARARQRDERLAPTGPIVIFSGGAAWTDVDRIWDGLDSVKARIPAMVLVTTAQNRGADAIAAAWAASRNVTVILERLDYRKGSEAGFYRNRKLVKLNPVEAIIVDGSGIQLNLEKLVREARIPLHTLRPLPNSAAPKRV